MTMACTGAVVSAAVMPANTPTRCTHDGVRDNNNDNGCNDKSCCCCCRDEAPITPWLPCHGCACRCTLASSTLTTMLPQGVDKAATIAAVTTATTRVLRRLCAQARLSLCRLVSPTPRPLPLSSGHLEVYNPQFTCIFHVPLRAVRHVPPPHLSITRLVRCVQYVCNVPDSCAKGMSCRFVHADVDYDVCAWHSIHVNYIWRHAHECIYERLPAGQVLYVQQPHKSTSLMRLRSDEVIVTRGALLCMQVLQRQQQQQQRVAAYERPGNANTPNVADSDSHLCPCHRHHDNDDDSSDSEGVCGCGCGSCCCGQTSGGHDVGAQLTSQPMSRDGDNAVEGAGVCVTRSAYTDVAGGEDKAAHAVNMAAAATTATAIERVRGQANAHAGTRCVARHCAHYFLNRMCRLGVHCSFIHAIYMDADERQLYQRAPVRFGDVPLLRHLRNNNSNKNKNNDSNTQQQQQQQHEKETQAQGNANVCIDCTRNARQYGSNGGGDADDGVHDVNVDVVYAYNAYKYSGEYTAAYNAYHCYDYPQKQHQQELLSQYNTVCAQRCVGSHDVDGATAVVTAANAVYACSVGEYNNNDNNNDADSNRACNYDYTSASAEMAAAATAWGDNSKADGAVLPLRTSCAHEGAHASQVHLQHHHHRHDDKDKCVCDDIDSNTVASASNNATAKMAVGAIPPLRTTTAAYTAMHTTHLPDAACAPWSYTWPPMCNDAVCATNDDDDEYDTYVAQPSTTRTTAAARPLRVTACKGNWHHCYHDKQVGAANNVVTAERDGNRGYMSSVRTDVFCASSSSIVPIRGGYVLCGEGCVVDATRYTMMQRSGRIRVRVTLDATARALQARSQPCPPPPPPPQAALAQLTPTAQEKEQQQQQEGQGAAMHSMLYNNAAVTAAVQRDKRGLRYRHNPYSTTGSSKIYG